MLLTSKTDEALLIARLPVCEGNKEFVSSSLGVSLFGVTHPVPGPDPLMRGLGLGLLLPSTWRSVEEEDRRAAGIIGCHAGTGRDHM